MSDENIQMCKLILTQGTFKESVSCMCSHMEDEISRSVKPSTTYRAGKWFLILAGVCSHMLGEITRGGELLVTGGTVEWSLD